MARVFLLIALCVLPALVAAARPARNPFEVEGRVFCDTCRAGFETPKSTYIANAKVRVECKDRKSLKLVYSKEGKTDATGTFRIRVDEDHMDELCETVLVSSPQRTCSIPAAGRDRAHLALTSNNGIVSQKRFSNNLGFEMAEPMSGCFELLQQYQEVDD